jgi:hypothetical protein
MKDVTITVVKLDKGGYRVVVNDDTVTKENAEGSKSNDTFFPYDEKEGVQAKVNEILGNLE